MEKLINKGLRKDKWWSIGWLVIHYVHYYPQKWTVAHYGWSISSFKGLNVDLYCGKHTLVFTFKRMF